MPPDGQADFAVALHENPVNLGKITKRGTIRKTAQRGGCAIARNRRLGSVPFSLSRLFSNLPCPHKPEASRPAVRRARRVARWGWQSLLGGALLLVFVGGLPNQAIAAGLREEATELSTQYAAQLEELAEWCDRRQLPEQARQTRRWLRPRHPYKLFIPILPVEVGPPPPPAGASDDLAEWHERFWRMRREQAKELFVLSRQAIRAEQASLAFDLLLASLREDPDYEPVRRLLGFQRYRNQWHTAYEVHKLRSGEVWHDKFGWLPRGYVRRYEEGMRRVGNEWMTAEEAAMHHRDIRRGWDIETEHYTIRTNHSLEAGVALGVDLERLYRVWKQLFVRYFATEAQVVALFEGRSRNQRFDLPRHGVVYFRSRDDYNQALRPAMPNIEISIGVYVESTRKAYFFAGNDYDRRTMFHEATHQLFHESRPVARGVGRRGNFWILEGVAMYMESLRQEDGFHVLGGVDDLRMQAARYRLLQDKFYVPLAEFSSYGLQQIQADPRIATLYSQAAGLTHFLIHFDQGQYRDALVGYLRQVYSGRDGPNTLPQLTEASYDELDAQYQEFIERTMVDRPRPGSTN